MAVLIYRDTCAKCRTLSLAIVLVSMGMVRRIPLSSPEANRLYAKFGTRPGKLALFGQRRVFTGWRTAAGLLLLPVLTMLSVVRPR